jgi:hypothetical protein
MPSKKNKLKCSDLPAEILDLQAGLHSTIQQDLIGVQTLSKEEDNQALLDLSFESLTLEEEKEKGGSNAYGKNTFKNMMGVTMTGRESREDTAIKPSDSTEELRIPGAAQAETEAVHSTPSSTAEVEKRCSPLLDMAAQFSTPKKEKADPEDLQASTGTTPALDLASASFVSSPAVLLPAGESAYARATSQIRYLYKLLRV